MRNIDLLLSGLGILIFVFNLGCAQQFPDATTTTSTASISTTTTTLGYVDYEFGPYVYYETPTTESLSIPAGATVYIGNLPTAGGERAGFCSFGFGGYLKINGEFAGYERHCESAPSTGSWNTYYYKIIGSYVHASTDESFSADFWVKYKSSTSLKEDGTWVDITSLLNLGQTNSLNFFHFTDAAKGFIIRVYE